MAKNHFVSIVFDYGCKKEKCLAFQNIHVTEKQKNIIRKAWESIEHLIASDDELINKIESFYAEFIN